MDLYSAGVQVVMAQKRINSYKTTYNLVNTGLVVQASHFPETGHKATFQVLQGTPIEGEGEGSGSAGWLLSTVCLPCLLQGYV